MMPLPAMNTPNEAQCIELSTLVRDAITTARLGAPAAASHGKLCQRLSTLWSAAGLGRLDLAPTNDTPEPDGADDTSVLTFGKHKGTALRDVPADYLLWLAEQDGFSARYPKVALYIKRCRHELEREADRT